MASTYVINRQKQCMRVGRPWALRAFTLIELMVAVAIIAVLIGILVPAFSAVHTNAKKVATKATIGVLDRGLESFRGEPALGGVYPPSQSDSEFAMSTVTMNDPFIRTGTGVVKPISGANLLVYGMAGADRLGTPGFRDLDGDGVWSNDQTSTIGRGGAYELDPNTADPLIARYPGTGAAFVDEPTMKSIRTVQEMEDTGEILTDVSGFNEFVAVPYQPYFTDKWGRPILYYRANRAASYMVTEPPEPVGVYDARDNFLFTGTTMLGAFPAWPGLDFGAGTANPDNRLNSRMGATNFGTGSGPVPEYNRSINVILGPAFTNTFQQFIYNRDITQRNEPVNRNTYLLISAGPDAVYGSSDDVVNWTRN